MVELATIIRQSVIEVPVAGGSLALIALAAAGRAEAAATATGQDRIATGQDRTATGQDRVQTGQDRTATGQDRTATGQDREQTGLDRIATGQDKTAADADAVATAADRVQTGLDKVATAADRAQAGLDRTAAAASATAAAAAVPTTADRNVGYRANDAAVWTTTRAGIAYVRGPAGVLVPVPADTMAMAFDAALAPKGPAFAGARTNLMLNPRFEGGTPGVIGSGGVLPSNMTLGPAVAGISYQIVAIGTLADGSPYLDVRYFGTATASGPVRFQAYIPVTTFIAGEYLATSIGYQLVAGSMANFTTFNRRTTGIAPAANPATAAPSATLTRLTFANTLSGGTTGASAGIELLWGGFAIGAALDATIRYVMPQMQRGPHIGSTPLPSVGTPGVSTEAQTSADIPVEKLGTAWNYRQGTIITDWSSRPGPFTSVNDSDWMGLVSWGDRTANERMGLVLKPAHTSIEARLTAGGVVQAAASRAIAAPAADVITRAALAWDLDAGKLQVAARGAAGAVVALSALPVPGWLMPGRFGPSHPGFVTVPGLEVRPAALFDAALAALTS